MKKEIKIIKKNGISYVAISLLAIALLIVGVGVKVNAGESLKQMFANALAREVAPQVVDSLSSDENQLVGTIPGSDVYNPIQFHEGLYPTFRQAVSYPASSTLNLAGNEAVDSIAEFYANRDLVCTDAWLDIGTAAGGGFVSYGFAIGTTTKTVGGSWTVTSTATIMASTTVATTDTAKTKGIYAFSNRANLGSYYNNKTANGIGVASSTSFLVNAGEYILFNYRTQSATSSATWAENRTKATANVNCFTR